MNDIVILLRDLTIPEAFLLFLIENLIIFGLAVASGYLLIRLFAERRVSLPPERIERVEIVLTISSVLLNTLITVVGWWMWREGIIEFRTDMGFRALVVDVLLLLIVMDLAMYLLHRAAHWAGVYDIVHRTHHRYDRPHPITLFVLNPFEALGFGSLWLIVVAFYDASWIGMSTYLTLNVLFGMVGHLGVEPLPDGWKRLPALRYISTSTFHAQHHMDKDHNFGFYTLIWDRLFGTLSPNYNRDFGKLPTHTDGSRSTSGSPLRG